MPFHQFKNDMYIPYKNHERVRKNLLDILISMVGLKKIGLDAIVEYFIRYARDSIELKPWLPSKLPENSFLVDFHSHTSLSDGEGTFESILSRIGKSRVLNGIAFTNHPWYPDKQDITKRIVNEKVVRQSFKARAVVEKMKKKKQLPENFITFEGSAEFAARGTTEFPNKGIEVIGIGLPKTFIEDNGGLNVIRNMLGEDLVDKIHENGGLAILPHPFYFVPSGLSRALWRSVDAVESFNHTTHVFMEPVIREFVNRAGVEIPLIDSFFSVQLLFGYFSWRNRIELARYPRPEVGSSDAHVEPFVGAGCTLFKEPVNDLEGLRQMLKKNGGIGVLNPLWDKQANLDEIIERIWAHWGKEIVDLIVKISSERRYLIPLVKILSFIFGKIQHAHDSNSGRTF
ncbi:MAG: PHP-associated domain-containing protein [Promethearchaeota archaeon]